LKIAVIGSLNMDYSLKVRKLPDKGETILASSFYTAAGGKGANQAVAARRLGAEVYMIGAVGRDSNGKELCSKLEAEGISTAGIKKADVPTGNAMITVDDAGGNTIVVYPGANAEVDNSWLGENIAMMEAVDFVVLQLEIPMETVAAAVLTAKKMGKKVMLNPAPAAEIPQELYNMIDVMTPNETELALLTGTRDIDAGARLLLEREAKSVVVTLGEEGCLFMDNSGSINIRSFKVKAIDSTAAGDCFNAALAVALCEGKTIEEALSFSNAAGAIAVTRQGAQESLPLRDEVERFLAAQ